MSKLFLIRHGQASLGANNYDQLSEVGYKQAELLGEHFKSIGLDPDRIIIGSLERHRQTAENICAGLQKQIPFEVHEGWNEFDFHKISYAFLKQYPEHQPTEQSVKSFFGVLRNALLAWSEERIDQQLPETWKEFEFRVKQALLDAQNNKASKKDEHVLVVSSGGAISMAMKHILGFDNHSLINLNLQSRNTGVTECYFNREQIYLSGFNALPHLEQRDKRHFITSA